MHTTRRRDKAVTEDTEIKKILMEVKHVTVAMCQDEEPYLVTLSHGFDEEKNCLYFHCAREGKKIDIMRANPVVWGQALIDGGYQQGRCDHFYKTAQFRGRVTFVDDPDEKEEALRLMIRRIDDDPEAIIRKQITPHSMGRILIGRIDIDYMSGKKADKIVVQL